MPKDNDFSFVKVFSSVNTWIKAHSSMGNTYIKNIFNFIIFKNINGIAKWLL